MRRRWIGGVSGGRRCPGILTLIENFTRPTLPGLSSFPHIVGSGFWNWLDEFLFAYLEILQVNSRRQRTLVNVGITDGYVRWVNVAVEGGEILKGRSQRSHGFLLAQTSSPEDEVQLDVPPTIIDNCKIRVEGLRYSKRAQSVIHKSYFVRFGLVTLQYQHDLRIQIHAILSGVEVDVKRKHHARGLDTSSVRELLPEFCCLEHRQSPSAYCESANVPMDIEEIRHLHTLHENTTRNAQANVSWTGAVSLHSLHLCRHVLKLLGLYLESRN
mmetsp:Transcript_64037/g.169615  ORF Transcript_64037/g.169615 Transcript_64037/m.169615 type:complete len:271 (+) Transcript_64037:1726-2538(+)